MSVAAQEYLHDAPKVQFQDSVGKNWKMDPVPVSDILADGSKYRPCGQLQGKKALVTGGDSGIGRSVVLLFGEFSWLDALDRALSTHSQSLVALEGADVTCTYLPEVGTFKFPFPSHPYTCIFLQEEDDAESLKAELKEKAPNSKTHFVPFDLRSEDNCKELVRQHIEQFGTLDTLVLNHAMQRLQEHVEDLPSEQWLETFETNIHPFFYIVKAAVPHMPKGATITMNASVNPFVGHPKLLDYTATKGAIVGFARALSNQLLPQKRIRVNGKAIFTKLPICR